jgi:hypothetical protein
MEFAKLALEPWEEASKRGGSDTADRLPKRGIRHCPTPLPAYGKSVLTLLLRKVVSQPWIIRSRIPQPCV